jgi:uncharacterized protein
MDLLHGVLLVAAGIAGGIIAAIVGGAAVITFPALLAAGLPPVMATAANTAALTPGLFLAAIYDRSQLPPFDRSFVAVALASIVGALIGAMLLLLTPERVFSALVPVLLGFATVLFAYAASPIRRQWCCRSRFMAAISAPAWGCSCLACFRSGPAAIIAPPTSPRTW